MIKFPGHRVDKRYVSLLVTFCLVLIAVLAPKLLDNRQLLLGTEKDVQKQATQLENTKEPTDNQSANQTNGPGKDQSQADQSQEQPQIFIHIVGAVEKGGVFQVKEGARLFEALELAKPNAEAALDALNLAEVVVDGQQYVVPTKAEVKTWQPTAPRPATAVSSVASGGTEIIHLNTASAQELETLPGIGPALAAKIVEYREQQGRFTTIEDLKKVSGIGDKKFTQIQSRIRL